jgi:hypothetical protein
MCTLSIIALDYPVTNEGPHRGGFRVVCNRDEHRERSAASVPRWRALPTGSRAIWPTDTHSGGTWIGGSEHGLVLAVLNHYPTPGISVVGLSGLRSRGLMIPELISEPTAEAVAARVRDNDLEKYAPFRLVAIDTRGGREFPRAAEIRWNRTELAVSWTAGEALCFASSGLGDARAAPRLPLFREMVVDAGVNAERQDEFHRHTWPDRPEVSVMMSRTEARTVSVTRLEMLRTSDPARFDVKMRYEPVPESAPVMRLNQRDQRR